MRSETLPLLPAFSDYLENHGFVETERRKHKWGDEIYFHSPLMELRMKAGRGEFQVEAKPCLSSEDWYDIQIVLEIVAGTTTKLLDKRNIGLLAAEMESSHEKLARFMSPDQRDRLEKYSHWIEASYWGNIYKRRASREVKSEPKQWWKFW